MPMHPGMSFTMRKAIGHKGSARPEIALVRGCELAVDGRTRTPSTKMLRPAWERRGELFCAYMNISLFNI